MQELLPARQLSALELSETIDELKKLTQSAVQLMGRERVRLYGGVPGDLTLIGWSHLQNAVDSLRALNAGRRCSGGVVSARLLVGGSPTSRF
jgi:hypothetical protein